MNNFLETIKSIYSFFKLNADERKFVFFSENKNYTNIFQPIIEKFLENNINIIYLTSDKKDYFYKLKNKNLKCFYISKTIGQIILLNNINCKNLIMTMPDLENFHIKRSKYCSKYSYMFHSPVSTNMIYKNKAFFHYDKIFCVGEHHFNEILEYKKKYSLKNLELIKAGYPKFDVLYSKFSKHEKIFKKNKITIAPSWGNKNIINNNLLKYLKILLEKNYEVNLRPHIQSFKYDKKILEEIEKKLSNNSNFKLEKENSNFEKVFESEFLITDWSGISIEFAFITKRPILFINTPKKINNKLFNDISCEPIEIKIRQKIGLIIEENDLINSDDYLKQLRINKNFKQEIMSEKKRFLYNFQNSIDFIFKKFLQIL